MVGVWQRSEEKGRRIQGGRSKMKDQGASNERVALLFSLEVSLGYKHPPALSYNVQRGGVQCKCKCKCKEGHIPAGE